MSSNKHIADSLNFFTRSLASSDLEELANLVEDYFTLPDNDEDDFGKLIPAVTLFIGSNSL